MNATLPPIAYIVTFRHPDTKMVVAESVIARNANEAMDAIWDRYDDRVGSCMVRPAGQTQWPRNRTRRA